jgi:hypothetical protein
MSRIRSSDPIGAVARKVVQNGPDIGEFVRHAPQLVERFPGALEFMQSKRAMNPAFRPLRVNLIIASAMFTQASHFLA